MKKTSQHLFNLIKSLTRSEKRYFSRYAQRHVLGEKNNYLRLFEGIAQQKEYDENALKAAFAGEKTGKHFAVVKHQLYHLVLDALHDFHGASTDSVQIVKWLHEGEILVKKGFPQAGAKLWEKARKTALKYEQYEWLPAVLQRENRLLARSELGKTTPEALDEQMETELAYLETLKTESTYWHLLLKIYRYHSLRGAARNETEKNHLEALIRHPKLQDESHATSFTARLFFYQIWGTYHFVQGDLEVAYRFNRKRLDLFHQQPQHIRQMPDRYLSAVKNFLVDCLTLERPEEFRSSLAYSRKLVDDAFFLKVPRLQGGIFQLTYLLELNQHVNARDFGKGLAIMDEVEAGLERHKPQITPANQTQFAYLIAYTYFGAGQYSHALRWLNQLLHSGEKESLQHIHAAARLFNLILHYEMNNFDLLESMIRSTQRYLQNIDVMYELESRFIRAFRRVINVASEQERRKVWKDLRRQIGEQIEDPQLSQPLQYFDLMGWLEAKIEGRNFGRNQG